MISTHILDTGLGKPATNVVVELYNDQGECLAKALTNQDGRVSDFGLTTFTTGNYSLVFYTADYFEVLELDTFFPKAVIHFSIANASQHYHIPLLISPFAYSTYRGS